MRKLTSVLGLMAAVVPLQLTATTLTINGVTYDSPAGGQFSDVHVQQNKDHVVIVTNPPFLLDYVQPIDDSDNVANDYSPVFKLSTQNFSVASGDTAVGTVEAMDGDTGATTGIITYSLASNPSNLFQLTSAGVLSFASAAVYNAGGNNVYYVGVVADDNDSSGSNTGQTLVRVEVTDGSAPPNNAPVFGSNTYAFTAINDGHTGNVGSVSATDADGDNVTYSLTGADSGLFTISSSGVVSLNAGNPASHSTKPSYSFSAVASDGTDTDTASITLSVNAPSTGGGGSCGAPPANVEQIAAIDLANPGTQVRVSMPQGKVVSIPLNTTGNSSYSGQIAIASTTGNSGVQREVWLSTCPGINDDLSTNTTYTECHATGNTTTIVKFRQTGTGDFRTCGLDVNSTYYLNIKNVNCTTGQCDVYRAIYTKGTP